MAHGVGPEFKPQYHKTKQTTTTEKKKNSATYTHKSKKTAGSGKTWDGTQVVLKPI
jgi:hypothetical protein